MRSVRRLIARWLRTVGCVALLAAVFSAAAENRPATGVCSSPHFSQAGGIYTNDLTVRLSAKSSAAVIRYTLDGSEPDENSATYSKPLSVTTSTLIKAKAFAPDLKPSPTVVQTYTLLDESLFTFSSNLPLVVIHTFGERVSSRDRTAVSACFISPAQGRSSLTGPADFVGRGTLKIRGRSSLEYPKHSFTFHTKDDSGDPRKVPLLGLPKDSAWVLYAPYPDKTLMRDALAYELSNEMGHYAPRTRFVELFASRSGAKLSRKSYAGVYVLAEKIKRGKDRVNIEKLGPEDNREPEITGGYIFKKDHSDKGDPSFRTRHGNHFFYVEPKANEITPAQKSWLIAYLNQFENVLYGPNFRDPVRGYAAYIDTASFIDNHWIVELTKNVDGIRFSNYLQKDRGGKIKMEPIWDWNLSFGNANGKQGWLPQNWYASQLGDSEYLWFRRLFQDPDFEQKYIDRWGALRTNIFAASNILARVDDWAGLLNVAQERNFRRWPILGRSVNPNYFVGQTYDEEVRWMKEWIRARIAWIDRQFVAAPSFSLKEVAKDSGKALALRSRTGKIYYTLDGTDPRLPGGGVSATAKVYSAPIPGEGRARLFARANEDGRWSSPTVTSFK